MSVYNTQSKKPAFSASILTVVITLFWVVVFALVTVYGIGGINQHSDLVSQTQPAAAASE